TYTRSRAQGNQNTFDYYVGNFALPIIHPNIYANLAGDLPNRFLAWGNLDVPIRWHFIRNFKLLPIIEYRNGFPWIALDSQQNYVGEPNRDPTRFRNFFSADSRLLRDFKVSAKYTIRLSVTGFNLTNHFNPLAIHNNIGDLQYGVQFGNYHRRYRFDFEVLF